MKQLKGSIVWLLLVLCMTTIPIFAQTPDFEEGNEKIETLRIAFLTRKLNLTSEEAQKFWPVYNACKSELKSANSALKNLRKGMKDGLEGMTDEEVTKFTDEFVAARKKEADIIEKYHKQFKQVLPIRKVAILYHSEKEFKQELLREMKARREAGRRN